MDYGYIWQPLFNGNSSTEDKLLHNKSYKFHMGQ